MSCGKKLLNPVNNNSRYEANQSCLKHAVGFKWRITIINHNQLKLYQGCPNLFNDKCK